ncbi:MAG: efflux RND transporter periplasmic adaptor subunit [Bradyrhizobium sp.]|uniref:efflux RND transporter periplasmic adaptor subunit n=1 Tax=Bradyrhizobium sp. TaxID=376 RepID=UPI001D49825E|nr:efflux RND transporter periplasmic adaptor subunit [Bradyrhizobium sp.]MBV9565861.1 efflux RND transporter periplasmic adaptor subunit [Bradyrhizobium sp.]
MKRLLLLLLVIVAGAYYANQAGLVPGWPPVPLPEWVPTWARVGQDATATAGGADGQGRRQGGRQARSSQGRSGRAADEGPVPVVVAAVHYEDVPVTDDAVATVQALNTVTVRPQVDGKLIELAFTDGQDVKKGDVLARIDPATYQAQYDQAVAKKSQDEATLANARNDLLRYQRLAQSEAASKQQADTQKALVAQLEAQVNGDQAAIDNAKATLNYTTITSPLDGRTGIRLVDQGNILHASDLVGIVIITQLKPISVIFNLPQQQLRAVNAAMAKGSVSVHALEADNTTVIDKGTIQVVDNQVDQTTGTIKFKALFPNEHLQLWPGQFINVRLYIDVLSHAVVVPTAAVQRGPNGAYVYVLGTNSKVSLRSVAIARQNETQAVVSSGLTPPEQVVTTGFSRLTDGAEVRVAPAEADTGKGSAPPGTGGKAGDQASNEAAPGSPVAADAANAPSPNGPGAASALAAQQSGAEAGTGEAGAGPAGGPPGERLGQRRRGQRPLSNAQAPPAAAPAPSQ